MDFGSMKAMAPKGIGKKATKATKATKGKTKGKRPPPPQGPVEPVAPPDDLAQGFKRMEY